MTDEPTLDEAASAIHDGEERPAEVEPSQALSDRLADWGEVSDAVRAAPTPPPEAVRELHIGNALAAFDEDRAFVDPIPASPGDPSLAAVATATPAMATTSEDAADADAAGADAADDGPLPPNVTRIGDAPSRRRGVWLASAAAALVLVLAGVGLLASQDSNDQDTAGAPEAANTSTASGNEAGGDGEARYEAADADNMVDAEMADDAEMTDDGEMEFVDDDGSAAGASPSAADSEAPPVPSTTASVPTTDAAVAETQVVLEPLELPVELGGLNLLNISPLPDVADPPCVDRLLGQLRGPGAATFTRAVDFGDNRTGYLFSADGGGVAAGFVDPDCTLVSQDVAAGWFFG